MLISAKGSKIPKSFDFITIQSTTKTVKFRNVYHSFTAYWPTPSLQHFLKCKLFLFFSLFSARKVISTVRWGVRRLALKPPWWAMAPWPYQVRQCIVPRRQGGRTLNILSWPGAPRRPLRWEGLPWFCRLPPECSTSTFPPSPHQHGACVCCSRVWDCFVFVLCYFIFGYLFYIPYLPTYLNICVTHAKSRRVVKGNLGYADFKWDGGIGLEMKSSFI